MPSTYQILATTSLSASASSVTFSAISALYTDLVLRISARTDQSGQATSGFRLAFNGTNSGSYTQLQGIGSSTGAATDASSGTFIVGTINGPTSSANTFSSQEIYIPNYAVTAQKQFGSTSVQENMVTGAVLDVFSFLQTNTQAITSITLTPGAAPNFVAGSSFYLYGIAKS